MDDPLSGSRLPGGAPLDAPAAARVARAAHAVEELCAILWEAMREELRRPRGPRVLELSERLAQVCSVVGTLAAEEPAPELAPPAPVPAPAPEIAIHDTRRERPQAPVASGGGDLRAWIELGEEGLGIEARSPQVSEEGRVAWATAIGGSLERHVVDGLPFAALLIEIVGVEWLAQAEPAAGLKNLLDRVEVAIGPELRPSDAIVRESPGRWWLMASRTDPRGARTLAERLARTVRAAARHRGQPLELAIGVAVCPDDGEDAAALAAHADVGLYAARAAGQPVAPDDAA
ncbi:MAG: diguanylate cyclase domain-containing protein [Solirubrobacterales bacterium]